MQWLGDKLKELLTTRGLTQEEFSARVSVSRVTVSEWLKGQVPKGTHLLTICRVLDVAPDSLFEDDTSPLVPAHRTRGVAKRTPERDRLAAELAREYMALLDGYPRPPLQMVCHADGAQAAETLSDALRQLAGHDSAAKPFDYHHVFRLIDKLGICVVFREFPEGLKDYAFYIRIATHKVIFVNKKTNVLDLIYPLLHEVVHAVRDTGVTSRPEYSLDEENLCERVASAVQFPPAYVSQVRTMLRGLSPAIQVNTLKTLARENHHTVYGLVKALERQGEACNLGNRGVHGADANLRKNSRLIENCLDAASPERYLRSLEELSPYLVQVLKSKAETITVRMLRQLLDLGSVLDARQIRDLLQERDEHACAV